MSNLDQNFTTPSAGQADWDSDVNGNFTIIARGYHVLGTAGLDVSTGDIVTVGSDGFYRPYDPNSLTVKPHVFAYKAVDSGEQDTFLLRGMVRSLGIVTPAIPGHVLFGDLVTAGAVVASYSGADRPIGIATYEDGLFFDPGRQILPETLIRSASISAVTGSSHFFSMDGGRVGQIRKIIMESVSGDLVELFLWSNSDRDEALFETVSGGVSTVGSFLDQAGLPYYNTDASTFSGLIYGTLRVQSDAQIGSDTIGVQVVFERSQ